MISIYINITTMCEFMIQGRQCKIPSKDQQYCHIHSKSIKLIKKVDAQAMEITILNKRLSEALRKLQVIEQCDYVKYQLAPLSAHCSFRQAIVNPNNKEIIEDLFQTEQSKAIHVYDELINKRNMIAHKFTSREWQPKKRGKTKHGRSVSELLRSLKTYQL